MLGYFLMPHPPIIVHEVGKGKEVEVNNTVKACDEAARRIASLKPDTLVDNRSRITPIILRSLSMSCSSR